MEKLNRFLFRLAMLALDAAVVTGLFWITQDIML